jgi:hypothetical protein
VFEPNHVPHHEQFPTSFYLFALLLPAAKEPRLLARNPIALLQGLHGINVSLGLPPDEAVRFALRNCTLLVHGALTEVGSLGEYKECLWMKECQHTCWLDCG